MPITLQLSALLRDYVGGTGELSLDATTVRGLLDELERVRPDVRRSVCDETGALRRHINLFVGTRNIREHSGLDTPLKPGDVVTIFQAVSGG